MKNGKQAFRCIFLRKSKKDAATILLAKTTSSLVFPKLNPLLLKKGGEQVPLKKLQNLKILEYAFSENLCHVKMRHSQSFGRDITKFKF
jgi:hypothetical protein